MSSLSDSFYIPYSMVMNGYLVAFVILNTLLIQVPLLVALVAGATVEAEVWLQGHVLDEHALQLRYEGVDRASGTVSFWSSLKRRN